MQTRRAVSVTQQTFESKTVDLASAFYALFCCLVLPFIKSKLGLIFFDLVASISVEYFITPVIVSTASHAYSTNSFAVRPWAASFKRIHSFETV